MKKSDVEEKAKSLERARYMVCDFAKDAKLKGIIHEVYMLGLNDALGAHSAVKAMVAEHAGKAPSGGGVK